MGFRLLAASVLIAACGHAAPASPPPEPAPTPVPAQLTVEPAADAPAWLGAWFATGTTRVIEVVDRSPAAQAGVKIGDEIISIDGVAMHASQEIVKTVAGREPGRQIALAVSRDGKPLELVVKLAKRPSDDRLLHDKLVGRPAPAFTATALDGTTQLPSSALRGNVVLLEFWAWWCEPCQYQFPHLNRLHQQYSRRGLSILALSDDDPAEVRDFQRTRKLAYPLGLDPGDRIRSTYLVSSLPTTIIIDRNGIVRYVAVGVADHAEVERVINQLL